VYKPLNQKATGTFNGIIHWIREAATSVNEHVRSVTPTTVSTSGAYTTERSSVIVVTDAVTITLNASPSDQEYVTVKRVTTAGNVTIDGNGKNIDGGATYSMVSNYDSYTFRYFDSPGEWLII